MYYTFDLTINERLTGEDNLFTANNSCLDGTHNCLDNAWCLYTSQNTIKCVCKTGYEGDGIIWCNSKQIVLYILAINNTTKGTCNFDLILLSLWLFLIKFFKKMLKDLQNFLIT